MCLKRTNFKKLSGESGIGYKIVRPTKKPDEFLPTYNYFGGRHNYHNELYWPGTYGLMYASYKTCTSVVKVDAVYKINTLYRVNHDIKTLTRYNTENMLPVEYPAGVSLYKEPQAGMYNLICRYTDAVAEDEGVIVAMEITPTEYAYFEYSDDGPLQVAERHNPHFSNKGGIGELYE
jgi:hypothetical protein